MGGEVGSPPRCFRAIAMTQAGGTVAKTRHANHPKRNRCWVESGALHGLKHALGCPACFAVLERTMPSPAARNAGRASVPAILADLELRDEAAAVYDACCRHGTRFANGAPAASP